MKNLTPQHLLCPVGEYPSVTELEDGRLLIVGKTCGLTREELDGDGVKVGRDETAIVIDRALLVGVLK